MTTIFKRSPDTTDSIWIRTLDTTFNIWMQVPEIGIDPQKVLLIVNSDVALSDQMADYYITARGLNATHKITKSLGTHETVVSGTDGVDPDTFYTNVVLPIANYIDVNAIEAVICSARVPHLVDAKPDPVATTACTSSVLGAARYIRDIEGGMIRGTGSNIIQPHFVTMQFESGWFYDPVEVSFGLSTTNVGNNKFLDFRTQFISLPYGRLGLPRFDSAIAVENSTDTQRMIDDAVAKDGVGSAGGEIHIGYHDRSLPDITGYQAELVRQYAVSAGITAKHYIRSYSTDWPAAPPESYSFDDMNAGILNESAFGMLGAAIANQNIDSSYKDSYTWVQGSWGFEATSAGNNFMGTMLKNGACTAIGAVQEPLSDGVNQVNNFFVNLLKGRAICEAMLFGKTKLPWYMDCWGDPLYAPYEK